MSDFPKKLFIFTALVGVVSCSSREPLEIPKPSPTVTREEAIATAFAYTQVTWMPEARPSEACAAWG